MVEQYINISVALFVATWIIVPTIIFLLGLQTFIYKKILDPFYFNDAHFNYYELSIFNSFPLFFMKTLAYIRAIVLPKTMLKRFNNPILIKDKIPVVYYLALLTMILIIITGVIFINSVLTGIVFYIN